jgi:DNA polymerase III alpha subunit
MGLNQVRELTQRTQKEIIQRGPFTSLMDFLIKTNPRHGEADNLIRCGALEGLGTIPDLLQQLKENIGHGGQLGLFSRPLQETEDWTIEEKVAAQEVILGVGVDAHPLELRADQIAATHAITIIEAAQQLGQRVRVAGMRQIWRRSSNARGVKGFHMILEDLEGLLDVFIPYNVIRRTKSNTNTSGPYVIEGVIEIDVTTGEPLIQAERLWTLI